MLSSAFWAQDFGGDDGLEPASFQKKYLIFYIGKCFANKLQEWQDFLVVMTKYYLVAWHEMTEISIILM